MKFTPFPKLPRLSREVFITEKIDGTNASVYIEPDDGSVLDPTLPWLFGVANGPYRMLVGSRTRWIRPSDDNHGFAAWAWENADTLAQLGPGHHFGEWWGKGIQRGYGLNEKRFSLFNVSRWTENTLPPGLHVVPTLLHASTFTTPDIERVLGVLASHGSVAAPGFPHPEGVVIYHVAANQYFKKTLVKDEEPKSKHQNKEQA
jgi:hypothetical protein